MSGIEFQAWPTMLGEVPYSEAVTACEKVGHYLKEVPAWPQLPLRSFLEDRYIQFGEGFPGLVVRDGKVYVDRAQDLKTPLAKLSAAAAAGDYFKFPVSRENAAGLHRFLALTDLPVRAVKGQVIGPVSWSLALRDNDGKAVAGDEDLAAAAAQLLKLKAAWMEVELRRISPNTVIFIDEPDLHSVSSGSSVISPEKAVGLLREVFRGIRGVRGIYCGGQPDWSMVLQAGPDILGLDAYHQTQSLVRYPREIRQFISDGGVIAWGIVPVAAADLQQESPGSLFDRLEETIAPLTRRSFDLPFRQLIAQSLLTPSGGLAGLTSEGADRALELLSDLSQKVKGRWGS